MKKYKKILIIVIIFLILGGIYFIWNRSNKDQISPQEVNSASETYRNDAREMTTPMLKQSILSGVESLQKNNDPKINMKVSAYLIEYVSRVPDDKDINELSGILFNLLGPCWGIPDGQCRE